MAAYCGHCGLPAVPAVEGRGLAADGAGHEACARRLELEPPRYCPRCRRRLVVQVLPDRWVARCAEHGVTTASTWTGGGFPTT